MITISVVAAVGLAFWYGRRPEQVKAVARAIGALIKLAAAWVVAKVRG